VKGGYLLLVLQKLEAGNGKLTEQETSEYFHRTVNAFKRPKKKIRYLKQWLDHKGQYIDTAISERFAAYDTTQRVNV
jgi:hypothetical protein